MFLVLITFSYAYKVIDDNIVYRLRGFISMLNEESENGSVIVVEGKRDARVFG